MADTQATNNGRSAGPRCIAIVGPFQAGKPTLLEAILARPGVLPRPGPVEAGNTVGDASPEARAHRMSTELSVASTNFFGDAYPFLDCPGSIEFAQDMRSALPPVDAAIVVCEADEKKIPQLQLVLRELEELKIPRFLFLNKIDKADKRVRETIALLQPASRSRAPSFTASTPRARSFRSRAKMPSARRKRVSPCWRSSPTMTTS